MVKCVVKLKNCEIGTKIGVVVDMDLMIMIVVTKRQKNVVKFVVKCVVKLKNCRIGTKIGCGSTKRQKHNNEKEKEIKKTKRQKCKKRTKRQKGKTTK